MTITALLHGSFSISFKDLSFGEGQVFCVSKICRWFVVSVSH